MLVAAYVDELTIQRELKKGQSHSYQVHVEANESDFKQELDYSLRLKCTDDGSESGTPAMEMRFTDLRKVTQNHVSRAKIAGSGTLSVAGTGLMVGLVASVKNPHFWVPLLVTYIPTEIKKGAFTVKEDPGNGSLAGEGTVKDESYTFVGEAVETTGEHAKINLSWKIGKGGWVESGKGSLDSPSGTLQFSLSER